MGLKQWAWLFGAVFTLIGVLGYIPGITTADGYLLGIFAVDGFHNFVHLLTGILALAVAGFAMSYARLYFQVFGVIYGLVTVVGFVQGSTVLGLFGVNFADNALHLVTAAAALWAGFGGRREAAPAPMAPSSGSAPGGGM